MRFFSVLTILAFIPINSYARSCSSYEFDKAEYYAEQAGKKIISEYGGGRDKRIKLRNCQYNSYSKIYDLAIEIYWNGSTFRDNNYNVDGKLKLNADGTGAKFSQTYASDSVKDMNFWRNMLVGAVVLGSLSSESNSSSHISNNTSSSERGYGIIVNNKCHKKVDIAIHYKNMSGNWVSDGWWNLSPYESTYLGDGGNRIKTNQPVMYYYAKSHNGEWTGNYPRTFQGTTYDMVKITDNDGDTEFSLTCK